MKTIVISGEIGWDVWPEDVRREFSQAGGEDVELEISSPGGYVYDGIEIFNIIKNYSGKVTAKLVGLAASMASYIPLAANKVVAESNAVFMIHNASTFSGGDHHDLRHDADILEGFTKLLSQKYVEKTGKTQEEILAMMDKESWFFGEEIKEAGFADEMVDGDSKEEKAAAVLTAKSTFENLAIKMKRQNERRGDIDKIAALLPENKTVSKHQKTSPSDKTQNPKGEKMDLIKLKNEHADVYAQAFEEGRLDESKRVAGHAIVAEKTGAYPFAMSCIQDKTKRVTDDDVFAEYQTAGMKKRDLKNSADDGEETEAVTTDTEGEGAGGGNGKTDDEKAQALADAIMARHKNSGVK